MWRVCWPKRGARSVRGRLQGGRGSRALLGAVCLLLQRSLHYLTVMWLLGGASTPWRWGVRPRRSFTSAERWYILCSAVFVSLSLRRGRVFGTWQSHLVIVSMLRERTYARGRADGRARLSQCTGPLVRFLWSHVEVLSTGFVCHASCMPAQWARVSGRVSFGVDAFV